MFTATLIIAFLMAIPGLVLGSLYYVRRLWRRRRIERRTHELRKQAKQHRPRTKNYTWPTRIWRQQS